VDNRLLSPRLRVALSGLALCALLGACAPAPTGTTRLRLYTSVTQDTVDAVLAVVAAQRPDLELEVFRAPTGELDARIAAERRSGGVQADLLWASDPLSVERYAADGLLAPLDHSAISLVPAAYRGDTFVGTRLLNLVIVSRAGLAQRPAGWAALADSAYRGRVALPDPGFAGSAFAAVGYFAAADGFGTDYYRRLRDNGAVQVQAIGDVITGVAEGRYDAGVALDKSVRDAINRGSPIELVWPTEGAIAVFSPLATFASSAESTAAAEFVGLVLSADGQRAIAGTGWQPIRSDVDWPHDGPTVAPDWTELFGRQAELLAEYGAIFGGR
jgi:iron(III) transport system substrate-binding protein